MAVLLTAGCSATAAPPAPTTRTSTTTSAAPTSHAPTPTPTPTAPTATEVGADGTRIRSDGAQVRVLTAPGVRMEKKAADDGSVHLTFVVPAGATTATPLAFVAGAHAQPFADGTATAGGGGLSPTHGTLAASSDDVLVVLPRGTDDVTVWFAGATITKTRWANQEGGRSLAVTPTAWTRAGGLAAHDLVWSQLVEREPDANSATMRAQLQCHELGAPDKPTWNLEPWRPEVSDLEMIAARCNPT
ncbi:DUF2599 domain-containing protein [Cellulomonas rhizosphaerae]|uniref:DUF2599 domain-containing protein n=1 Tax=Cellulomonas rhizosphaerae TaxID=2293719 RepID=A0A413RHX0_9CELL|nr:DUF2599 domain-containing protein [Cellulomonas rhizosphaerae]RHA37785.1 DUF2599 domain-containing protein [Cellulomonas rhizosphaerae]